MINIIRKNQQFLMILVTVLVIIAFAWLYNAPHDNGRGPGTRVVAQVYGKDFYNYEANKIASKAQIAMELGMFELLQNLMGNDRSGESFIWNTVVLKHEASRFDIHPTDSAVKKEIEGLQTFQTNGQFDSEKYNQFIVNALTPRGFTAAELEEIIRLDLQLKQLKEIVGSTTAVSSDEVKQLFEQQYSKAELSVVRFKKDAFKSTAVSDEDLKKAYEERKESLRSEEQRGVKFVALVLDDKEKALTGPAKRDALQKLADKTDAFAVALSENGKFDEIAKQQNLTVKSTGLFTQAKLDPALEKIPNAAAAIFQLTAQNPVSDPIQIENGFYIFNLEKTVPSEPLTFEKAKANLAKQLETERTQENLALKTVEIRKTILKELEAGKSFADAAKSAGQTAEKLPAFSMAEPKLDMPDGREIVGRLASLTEKELSEFVQTPNGGLLIYFEKRQPVEQAEFEKQKGMLMQNLQRYRKELAFREWLNTRREEANIKAVEPQA